MWVDASIRFKTGNLITLNQMALANGGIALTIETGHSIYAATDPGTYEYLPAPHTSLISTMMYGASCIFIFNTQKIYDNIFTWWVLCSLYEDCVAHSYDDGCNFKDRYKDFAGCHRFDQSILNIIVGQYYKFNSSQYHVSETNILDVHKHPTYKFKVQYCGPVDNS